MKIKATILSALVLLAPGCTTGGGSSGFSSNPATNAAVAPPPIAGDQGAQDFLARSGFLGFASINDRAIGQNRFLAYHSRADVLAEDKNGIDDIYLKDTKLGTTIIVSKATDGTQGNAASTQASISADGRFVVYRSAASNLVAGDTNGTEDIFMYNVLTGFTTRVSVGAGAAESNGTSLTPAVSNGGQYVVFASEGTNLVATDTNAQPDIFLRDTVGNTTSLISSNSALLDSANGASFDPAISPDGAFVAFSTESTNITATALNGTRQVVRIERATPANRVLVSQTGGTQANGPCYEPSISSDGNIIAFFTNASNLAADTNTFFDVYVRNISGTSTTRASLDSGGGESDGHSGFPSISGDGTIVTFGSLATDLVAGDTNSVFDVFSRTGSTTTRVSVDTAGTQANVDSDLPAVSLDGRYVAFRSAASNLDGNDTTFDDDIFMRDLTTPSTVLHSIACRIPAVFAGFSAATAFTASSNARTVVLGDFNGDGNLDLASSDDGAARVLLMLGNGAGSLGVPSFFPISGANARGLTSADFNGDGNLDLASCHLLTDDASVLLGDGLGGFAAAVSFAVGDFPESIIAADFNNDSNPDLLTANLFDDTVALLLGDGLGGFAAPSPFAVGDGPSELVAGDFNNDGNIDLAVTEFNVDTVSLLLGDGAGNLTVAATVLVGDEPQGIAAGDFNGDGNLDIVACPRRDDNVTILLGNGAGGFAAPSNFPTGAGTFPIHVTAKDLDGDGDLDLATSNDGDDTVSVLLGDGTGSFGTATSMARTVTATQTEIGAGDFDNDGHLDIVATNSGFTTNNVDLFLNQRPDWAGVSAATDFAVGNLPSSVALGDLDGDGDLDMAAANFSDNNLSVLLNNGAGSFGTATNYPVGLAPRSVALGDVDGDGDLDLASANLSTDNLSVLLNDGTGSFGAASNFPAGDRPTPVVLGDMDGDGDLDLATANALDDNVSVLLNNGAGSFGTASNFPVGDNPQLIALGDVDGDGDLDLAVPNFSDNNLSVLLNNGSGSFGTATNFLAGATPFSVALGDVDRDGDLDLISANSGSNDLSVLLNDGTGSFGVATSFPVGNRPRSVTLGDVDGDGDLDLATSNQDSNNLTVLLNNGSGSFGAAHNLPIGSNPLLVVLGDVDGDGDLDVAASNRDDHDVSVLLNQACP